MKKRFKRLLNKKGLTLVEILVVLVVSSILIGIAMGMLMPVKNLMNSLKGNAHLDAVCDTANEYIRGRLQNAVSVKMMKGETDDDINSIGIEAQAYLDAAGSTTKLKALAVLGTPDPNDSTVTLYQLYDFGTIVNGGTASPTDPVVQISELKGYIKNPQTAQVNYGAFRTHFYENASYSVTFSWGDTHEAEVTKEDGTADTPITVTDWLKVTSTCFKNGEQTNQERNLSFKIFGGSVQFDDGKAGDGSGAMVILYTVKDIDAILTATP